MDDLVGSPCPFCGSSMSSVMRQNDRYYRVSCVRCGASGPPDVGNRLSVAGWNKRPAVEALRTQIEALTAERDRLALALAIEGGDLSGAPVVEGCRWEVESSGARLEGGDGVEGVIRRRGHRWVSLAYPPRGGVVESVHKTALDAMEAIAAVLGQVTHE